MARIAGIDLPREKRIELSRIADEFRRRGTFFIRLGTTTFFDLIDANGDQQISQDELNQPMERWFVRKDSNNDGNIDAEEFSQGRPSFGRRHR